MNAYEVKAGIGVIAGKTAILSSAVGTDRHEFLTVCGDWCLRLGCVLAQLNLAI